MESNKSIQLITSSQDGFFPNAMELQFKVAYLTRFDESSLPHDLPIYTYIYIRIYELKIYLLFVC